MDSGYYAACAGMAAQTQVLEIVANNLANLGTTGYRKQEATFHSLLAGGNAAALSPLNTVINDYGVLSGSHSDLTPGSLTSTGNPFDLGIEGGGFFAIQSDKGVLYTRNGNFHRASNGQMVTAEGDPVLGEHGAVTLPNGVIAVGADGTVSVNGAVADRIRLAEFAPNTGLSPMGNSFYSAPAGSELPAATSSVQQGVVESSNVSPVQGMVELIEVQRNAEMLQRAITIFDSQFDQTAVQDLPKV